MLQQRTKWLLEPALRARSPSISAMTNRIWQRKRRQLPQQHPRQDRADRSGARGDSGAPRQLRHRLNRRSSRSDSRAFDEMVKSPAAKSLTTGEVQTHLTEVYEAEVSRLTIFTIAEKARRRGRVAEPASGRLDPDLFIDGSANRPSARAAMPDTVLNPPATDPSRASARLASRSASTPAGLVSRIRARSRRGRQCRDRM